GPDGAVVEASARSIRGGDRGPAIGRGIVAGARVEGDRIAADVAAPSPDDHLGSGPDGGMLPASGRRVEARDGGPAVVLGVVAATGIERGVLVGAAPNDHLRAGPDRRVLVAGSGSTGGRHRGPTLRDAVTAASVQSSAILVGDIAAPNDHLLTGPDRRVLVA